MALFYLVTCWKAFSALKKENVFYCFPIYPSVYCERNSGGGGDKSQYQRKAKRWVRIRAPVGEGARGTHSDAKPF